MYERCYTTTDNVAAERRAQHHHPRSSAFQNWPFRACQLPSLSRRLPFGSAALTPLRPLLLCTVASFPLLFLFFPASPPPVPIVNISILIYRVSLNLPHPTACITLLHTSILPPVKRLARTLFACDSPSSPLPPPPAANRSRRETQKLQGGSQFRHQVPPLPSRFQTPNVGRSTRQRQVGTETWTATFDKPILDSISRSALPVISLF